MYKETLQGRFMNHPLHPLFVHLPVGAWLASLICDAFSVLTDNSLLASTSYYCILIGCVGALIAVIPGLADFVELPKDSVTRRIATAHMLLNVSVTILFFVNFFVRRSGAGGPPLFVTIGDLAMTIICCALLGASGYLGGLLVYDYGVGQKPQKRSEEASKDKPSLKSVA
ncbi:DUF2231 domain-containing protein [Bdellovibrionota bacterium FG-2]